jgi:hypothetical protein
LIFVLSSPQGICVFAAPATQIPCGNDKPKSYTAVSLPCSA